jgi:hypothetical protein
MKPVLNHGMYWLLQQVQMWAAASQYKKLLVNQLIQMLGC